MRNQQYRANQRPQRPQGEHHADPSGVGELKAVAGQVWDAGTRYFERGRDWLMQRSEDMKRHPQDWYDEERDARRQRAYGPGQAREHDLEARGWQPEHGHFRDAPYAPDEYNRHETGGYGAAGAREYGYGQPGPGRSFDAREEAAVRARHRQGVGGEQAWDERGTHAVRDDDERGYGYRGRYGGDDRSYGGYGTAGSVHGSQASQARRFEYGSDAGVPGPRGRDDYERSTGHGGGRAWQDDDRGQSYLPGSYGYGGEVSHVETRPPRGWHGGGALGYGYGGEMAYGTGFEDADAGYRTQGYRSQRGRGPRGYMRSDERILEDVNERLTEDHLLDASDIQVRCEGGRLTLEGEVGNRWMKHRAEDIVDAVSGAREVDNRIRVVGASRDTPQDDTSAGTRTTAEPAATATTARRTGAAQSATSTTASASTTAKPGQQSH